MKRRNGRRYMWTDHVESFTANYANMARWTGLDETEFSLLEDVPNNLSTYDYAVDTQALFSEILQELLK